MFKVDKTKFVVLVSDGVEGFPCPAVQVRGYNQGLCISYKNPDGIIDRVYCGEKYKPLKIGNHYWVGKRLGNNSVCGLCEVDLDGVKIKVAEAVEVVGLSSDPACPGDDLSALVGSDILGVCVRSLYSTGKIPWKWILIIGGAAAVIFLLYKSGIFHRLGIG